MTSPPSTRQSLVPGVSLKWLLLGLLAVGAGVGLLGRAFLDHHQVFRVALAVLSTIVPFVLAIVTIIVLGRRLENRRVVVWAVLLALVPPMGFAAMATIEYFVKPGVDGLGLLAADELVEEVPQRFEEPWVWNELSERLGGGKLSADQADTAVAAMAREMLKKKSGGWDSPLHWGNDFLKQAAAAGYLKDETLVALHDAFYGPKPVVAPLDRLREGADQVELQIDYGSVWDDNSGLPWRLVWNVEQVTINDEPAELDDRNRRVDSDDLHGRIKHNFMPGTNVLRLRVEAAYVDASKLFGLDTTDLPRDRWPAAKKAWTHDLEIPIEVHAPGDQLVKLTTDPQFRPLPGRHIRVRRLVVQQGAQGYSVAVQLDYPVEPMVSISADMVVDIDGQQAELGPLFLAHRNNGTVGSGDQYSGTLEAISAEATQGDVALLPNPAYVEQYPEVQEVWGRRIIFRNVPLERLDLKAEDAGDAPP